jgi:hypothetical protein
VVLGSIALCACACVRMCCMRMCATMTPLSLAPRRSSVSSDSAPGEMKACQCEESLPEVGIESPVTVATIPDTTSLSVLGVHQIHQKPRRD